MSRRRPRRSPTTNGIRWGLAALIGLFAAGLFLNTLGHELVFDDVTLILQNPLVTSLDWRGIVIDSGYRPVRTLTYAVNYAISGERPFSYHLVNVLLHGANALLLFRLIWLLTASNLTAGIASALFACHPAQTAAVAYVSGRKDLLAAFFILLALNLFLLVRKRERPAPILAVGSGLAFLLALGSKEVAIVFPGLLLLVDAWLERQEANAGNGPGPSLFRAAGTAVTRSPALYGSFVVLASAGLYWALAISKASRMEEYWGGTVLTNLGTGFKLFGHYLKQAVFPYPLLADYLGDVLKVSIGLAEPATLLAAGLLAGYVVLGIVLFRRYPSLSLGLLWFLICLVPVLQLIPFHELAADHFLYLPLVGWSIVVATLAAEASKRAPFLAWPALGALVIVFSLVTVGRNADWKDKQSLWEATLAKAPRSYRANVNLGQIYFSQGLVERGIELTQRGLDLAPGRSLPHANLGAMYYTVGRERRLAGRLDEAVAMQAKAREFLEKAVALEPKNPFTVSNLANTYKEEALVLDERRQPEAALAARFKARDLLDEAFKLKDPRREVQAIWMNYAGLYLDAGHYRGAIPFLEKFLKAFPEDATGNYWMGICRFQVRDFAGAVPHLERASVARPTGEIWEKLAVAYEQTGRKDLSLTAWRQAARTAPSPGVHYGLARMLLAAGNAEEARNELLKAMALDHDRSFTGRIARLLEEIARTR